MKLRNFLSFKQLLFLLMILILVKTLIKLSLSKYQQ